MKATYPERDRGVYRAAANPKSPLHAWAKKLVEGLGSYSGILAWCYRDRRSFGMKDLVYAENPFLKMLPILYSGTDRKL